MKKGIVKLVVFGAVFLLALIIVGRLMNKGHDNLTMEMAEATLPVVTMKYQGREYNALHGYTTAVDCAFQRETVTVLGESREAGFVVDTYGQKVTNLSIEVRSADGARLIENTELQNYETGKDRIEGKIFLKDLIDRDEEYSLAIKLELEDGRQVSYYTRVIWSDALNVGEKLAYVVDFHKRLYDREAARELTRYMETNDKLEDNRSFHNVNIHSSFRQLTWDELNVTEETEPVIYLTDLAKQTASILMDYIVSTSDGRETTYYTVEEHYRIRYTPERIYLLDYQRNMTQIPETDKMCAHDKILLGITGTDISLMESEDGNIVVFEVANRLFSYDVTTNKLTLLFSFYDEENADARTLYNRHTVRVLDVDEGGNVQFAVYGYMNRGRHEGEVGLQLYTYNSALNATEELVYIPYKKTYAVLKAEMERLLYLNRGQKLYLTLENMVYRVDLAKKNYFKLLEITRDDGLQVSDDYKIAVWADGNLYDSTKLNIRNLSNDTQYAVEVDEGESIRPLGFMEEDIIYGVARTADIEEESSGRIFFPMYKIGICNSRGDLLKEYEQPGIYVTECTVAENQITLKRLRRAEDGSFFETSPDHILNSVDAEEGKNVIVTADIERYKQYVEIKVRRNIDTKALKVLTPKEIVYEGGRVLNLPETDSRERYYVYGPYGVNGIFLAPSEAVKLAYSISGVVTDEHGQRIWLRGNRVTRNQILAIKEPEKSEAGKSLAVCLDAIFKFEGLMRNSENFLEQGKTVLEILEENLEDVQILDLTGCSLDAMLYYVNRDLPVLALLEDGEAVLVTGFNESQIMLFEPSTGRLYKRSTSDSAKWFEENGNCFITYVRK